MHRNWRLVRFQAGHAPLLSLTPGAAAALRGLVFGRPVGFGEALAGLAARYEAAGPAWTLLRGERPVACGGAVRFWAGVGECWLWLGGPALENPVALARHARRAMLRLREDHGFVRLQVHVREDSPVAARFAKFLGLEFEGKCPGFGPDQATHHLYGRFWQWKA